MNKTAGLLWAVGSMGLFIMVVLYVGVYQPPSGTDAEKTTYLLNNLTLISGIWRTEMVFILLLTISSCILRAGIRALLGSRLDLDT